MIARRIAFDAGHRVRGSVRCGGLHGHRFAVEVTVDGPSPAAVVALDGIESWVLRTFADAFVVQEHDPMVPVLEALNTKTVVLDVPPCVAGLTATVRDECRFALAGGVRLVRVRGCQVPGTWVELGGEEA